MLIVVPKETFPGEHRVALIPTAIGPLVKKSIQVQVESGAGLAAGFTDEDYRVAGAQIVNDRAALLNAADIVLQVRTLGANPKAGQTDLKHLREPAVLIGTGDPLGNPQAMKTLADCGVTLFAMELIPRITRAQSMDVLSSMATIAGYKAVLLAANHLPRIFPMLMTAAGTLTPAKVLVIGAGVAGLQAIASAKRLGAVVSAYDVRPAVKEQIESLGGKFIELDLATADAEDKGGYAKALAEDQQRRQREQLANHVAECDACITTAAVPGKPSPVLITADAVRRMRPGSVIIDLAAERGGNCELTKPDQTVVENNITILGPTNLPSEIPLHASQMYAKNLTNFLGLVLRDGKFHLNLEDEVVRDTLVATRGEVVHPRIRELLNLPPLPERPAGSPPVEHLAKQ